MLLTVYKFSNLDPSKGEVGSGSVQIDSYLGQLVSELFLLQLLPLLDLPRGESQHVHLRFNKIMVLLFHNVT